MKNLYYTITGSLFLSLGSSAFAQTAIVDEDFQSGIPANYILYNEDGYTPHTPDVVEYTAAWISKEDPEDSANLTASSTSYFVTPGLADRWMVIPSLNLGAFGNHLSWVGKSHDASFSENYLVLVSTTTTAVESFTDTIATVLNEDVYWTNHTVNLSEKGYDGQTIHIAFVLRTIDGFKFYMDSLKVVKDDPVSVKNTNLVNFSVYPNPTTDVIQIQSEVAIQQVVIRDLNGAIVMQSNQKVVDVRHLTQGVYFVELVHQNGISSKRFIKQ